MRDEATTPGRDAGIGVIEVIVAMAVLGFFASILAPVLANSLRLSAHQTRVAYAAQQVSRMIDAARDTPTCTELKALHSAAAVVTTDPQGRSVSVKATLADPTINCATAPFPSTMTLTVTATGTNCAIAEPVQATCTLARASTNVLVWG